MHSMASSPPRPHRRTVSSSSALDGLTTAAFSPSSPLRSPSSTSIPRPAILVQQKSALLVATPPQITRALAYSHPFILTLNKLVGLLSWTTGDPWESFLLLSVFWAATLYADLAIRWTGPLVLVVGLIFGMYARRYSPLSSTEWTGEKKPGHKRGDSDAGIRHAKSLDEIVETLKQFTTRCNILLEPFIRLTEFLSTQTTATSATTRPALTALFTRILLVTPVWILFTLPPFQIITSKRIVLAVGTTILTWHSQPARVSRTIFWRSRFVRRLCSAITGLTFSDVGSNDRPLQKSGEAGISKQASKAAGTEHQHQTPGIRFTFALYENQRRWLGIGWTSSMLAYERAAWTDEHLHSSPPKDKFELPKVDGAHAAWKWVEGSEWRVEGAEDTETGPSGDGGWIYYDNKWRDGRKGKDGWNRYTRRRKWVRDAELVEITEDDESPASTPETITTGGEDGVKGVKAAKPTVIVDDASATSTLVDRSTTTTNPDDETSRTSTAAQSETHSSRGSKKNDTDNSSASARSRQRRGRGRASRPTSERSVALSSGSTRLDEEHEDVHMPFGQGGDVYRRASWGVSDDVFKELG